MDGSRGNEAPPDPSAASRGKGQGGDVRHARIRASDLPLAGPAPAALAFILGADGPSYRPVGAAMVVDRAGRVRGSLSSGCIDADIARHAAEVAARGRPRILRYGAGSPFLDLELPCGGGLDVGVWPAPPAARLKAWRAALDGRRPLDLWLAPDGAGAAPQADALLALRVDPDPRLAVFGKGPEALAFARMAAGAGYATTLVSPDPETLGALGGGPARAVALSPADPLEGVAIDAWTAGVLFFHDHDLEPPILARLLAGPAFYVGAQGSRRTAARRIARLRAAGLAEAQLARLRGPIGVIPSTRDPRTLAASVLAEVLAEAQAQAAAPSAGGEAAGPSARDDARDDAGASVGASAGDGAGDGAGGPQAKAAPAPPGSARRDCACRDCAPPGTCGA